MGGIGPISLPQQHISHSASDTRALGELLGSTLPSNSVICFFGDLGAGKTTFIKGLAAGLLGTSGEEVGSPTFTYLNIYHSQRSTLYHFDLYRLHGVDDFLAMGFDEMLYAGGVCCIEWAEKIAELKITGALCVKIDHLQENIREITVHEL